MRSEMEHIMEPTFKTREEWLKRAVRILRPLLRKADITMRPRWQVSMSLASTRKAIGQCWYEGSSSSGRTANILICPTLGDPVEVLDTLLHEMIHAALPYGVHHGPKFVRACKAIGMTQNKPTSAAACPALRSELARVAAFLGPFPHDAMVVKTGGKRGTKGGYWPFFQSPVDERYRVQVSERSLKEYGPPVCPISGEPMVLAQGKAPRW